MQNRSIKEIFQDHHTCGIWHLVATETVEARVTWSGCVREVGGAAILPQLTVYTVCQAHTHDAISVRAVRACVGVFRLPGAVEPRWARTPYPTSGLRGWGAGIDTWKTTDVMSNGNNNGFMVMMMMTAIIIEISNDKNNDYNINYNNDNNNNNSNNGYNNDYY